MINGGEIEFYEKIQEQNVSVLLKEVPKPFTIFYQGGGQQAIKETPQVPIPKLVMKVPTPFCYASDKVVPWNYASQTITLEPQAVTEQKLEKSVNDIVGMGGMTRRNRCYAPVTTEVRERESSAENGGVKIAV